MSWGRVGRAAAAAIVLATMTGVGTTGPAGGQEQTETQAEAEAGGRIIGGSNVPTNEMRYVGAILLPTAGSPFDRQYCSATLIAPRVAATALSCGAAAGHQVLFNQHDLDAGVTGDLRTIGAVSGEGQDFTLIKLTTASGVTPVDVASSADTALYPAGTSAITAGWGFISATPPTFSPDLRRVTLSISTDGACDAEIPSSVNEDLFVCGSAASRATCLFDEGAPLIVDDGGDDLLVGVLAASRFLLTNGSCPTGQHEVFADSGEQDDFIAAHLAPDPFSDVSFSHGFRTPIWSLTEDEVLGGFPDGTYRPQNPVSRQAMAAFMYRLVGEPPFTPPGTNTFPDVPTDHTFFEEIEWLVDEGITIGFLDGTFHPGQAVTRQAMSAFMYRLAGEPPHTPGGQTFDDVPSSHIFFDEIDWMADEGITTGFPGDLFKPAQAVSRQAMAAFMYRLQPLLS